MGTAWEPILCVAIFLLTNNYGMLFKLLELCFLYMGINERILTFLDCESADIIKMFRIVLPTPILSAHHICCREPWGSEVLCECALLIRAWSCQKCWQSSPRESEYVVFIDDSSVCMKDLQLRLPPPGFLQPNTVPLWKAPTDTI